jgi:hypothetical protein
VRRSSPRSLPHSWHLPAALCPEFSWYCAIPRLYGLSTRTPRHLLHAVEGSDDRPLASFIGNPVEVSEGGVKRTAIRRSHDQEGTRGPQRRSLWSYPKSGDPGRVCKASLGRVSWQPSAANSSHEQLPASTDLLISDDCDCHLEDAPEGDALPPRVARIWSHSSKLPERSGPGSLRRTRLRDPDPSG